MLKQHHLYPDDFELDHGNQSDLAPVRAPASAPTNSDAKCTPTTSRIRMWLEASGGRTLKHESNSYSVYRDSKLDTDVLAQIEKDIPRCHLMVDWDIEGQAMIEAHLDKDAMLRVLVAHLNFSPDFGYAQGLDQMVTFLPQLTDEENAFWILCGLNYVFLPKGHFDMLMLMYEHISAAMRRVEENDPQCPS